MIRIPRKHIEAQKQFVAKLKKIKYIHFRELYKNIDSSNFQTCTRVDFKALEYTYDTVWETWGRLVDQYKPSYNFRSKSGSQYFITNDGDVYRLSNHWGAVASCEWTREGKGQLMMSVFETGDWEIGVANLRDFKVFVRKNIRKRDVLVNPEWVNQMQKVIPIKKRLGGIKSHPEFKNLSNEDKQLIGSSLGFFINVLNIRDSNLVVN